MAADAPGGPPGDASVGEQTARTAPLPSSEAEDASVTSPIAPAAPPPL